MPILKRTSTVALVQGATWGTAPAFPALSGAYAQTFSGFPLERENTPDMGAGFGLISNSEQGNDTPPSVSLKVWPYEADKTCLLLLAMMFGTDVVTGAGDPYSHTLTMQETSDLFFAIGGEEGTEIKVIPSVSLTGLDITFANGIAEFDATGTGNTVSIAGGTVLDSVTYSARTGVFQFKNTTFRINAQSGDALAAGDAVQVSDLKLSMKRDSDRVIVTGSTNILQPAEGPFPEWTLEFTIPHKNATSVTLYTAFAAQTLQKVDITMAGTTADRSLTVSFPQVKLTSVTNPYEEIQSTKVMCSIEKASANPSGMAFLVPTAVWKTSIAASVLA